MSKIIDNINDIETIVSKQDTLVSGTNIKTVNGESVLGSGNMLVGATIDYQEFTTSGTWTKPVGCNYVYVEALGGGGSGAKNTSTNIACGGAGGEFVNKIFKSSDVTSSVTITVGSGGASQNITGSGYDGGNSMFGTLLTAYGGGAGVTANRCATTRRPNYGQPNNQAYLVGNPFFGIGGSHSDYGFSTVYGGGGGGGAPNAAGGASSFAGNGGKADNYGVAENGTYPSGGGGGANGAATQSGAGANGRVRVW